MADETREAALMCLTKVTGALQGVLHVWSLAPHLPSDLHSLCMSITTRHRKAPAPVRAGMRQLTNQQLPILQQQRHISLRPGRSLNNEFIAESIAVEARKLTIIASSTTIITTHLLPHIPHRAMSPAAEEEPIYHRLRPNGISMLRTTFYRAMMSMCRTTEVSRTSPRTRTTSIGSCKQFSRSSLFQIALVNFVTSPLSDFKKG